MTMGVEQVNSASNQPKKVIVNGENGTKLNRNEAQLAKILANVDGKAGLSRADMQKLQGMPYAQQVKYINDHLKAAGSKYRVASKVYDEGSGDYDKGIQRNNQGVSFNLSLNGTPIEESSKQGTVYLNVKY